MKIKRSRLNQQPSILIQLKFYVYHPLLSKPNLVQGKLETFNKKGNIIISKRKASLSSSKYDSKIQNNEFNFEILSDKETRPSVLYFQGQG